MIQASIKACYSDYSLIDVGSHKNSLIVNQFNPMNWHGQLINEWMRNHRRTKTPSAQATRSTLVLMHGATNRAGYELYSFIEFVFESWVCSLGNQRNRFLGQVENIFWRRKRPKSSPRGAAHTSDYQVKGLFKQLGSVPLYGRQT